MDQIAQAGDAGGIEEEYHTEDSDVGSDSGQDNEAEEAEQDPSENALPSDAPLLPLELLKPLPSPAYSPHDTNIPWEQMTRKEKRRERQYSRRAKKQVWIDLKEKTNGTAVLEKGRVAQLKRGVKISKDRVRIGRVEKPVRQQKSGRQQLLEQRRKLLGIKGGAPTRSLKRTMARNTK